MSTRLKYFLNQANVVLCGFTKKWSPSEIVIEQRAKTGYAVLSYLDKESDKKWTDWLLKEDDILRNTHCSLKNLNRLKSLRLIWRNHNGNHYLTPIGMDTLLGLEIQILKEGGVVE